MPAPRATSTKYRTTHGVEMTCAMPSSTGSFSMLIGSAANFAASIKPAVKNTAMATSWDRTSTTNPPTPQATVSHAFHGPGGCFAAGAGSAAVLVGWLMLRGCACCAPEIAGPRCGHNRGEDFEGE